MAPLTWRNVDAPDLSKASQILNQSATMLGNAGEGISGTLTDIRNRQRRDRSAAVLPELAKVANEQGVAGALAQMGSMISPQDMTPELQQAMMNLRGNALGYESSRAATTSIRDSNNRQQQNHDIGIKRDQELAATTPALVDAMLRAQGLGGQAPQAAPAPTGGGDYPIGVPVNGPGSAALEKYSTGVAVDPWEGRKDVQAGIFAGESGGDYNALFGYSNRAGGRYAGQKLTDMTVSQALDFSNPSGDYGQWVKSELGRMGKDPVVATPMGAYQIVGATLREAVKAGVVRPDEKFTEAVQDRVGAWILETQGTGAWEGYRGPGQPGQTGSGSRGPVDLFSIIPPGTSIRPQDIIPQLTSLQNAQETGFNRANTNEDRALAAAERAKVAEEERIQREAMDYVQTKWGGFSPENPQDTLNQIYADENLSTEQKTAYATAVKKFYEDNPTNFDLSGNASVSDELSAGLSSVRDSASYMQTTDRVARLVQAAEKADDSRSPAEVIGDVKKVLGEDVTVSVPDFLNVVDAASNKYGLDPNMVARVAETMIVGGGFFGEDVAVDRANLMAQLDQTFGDGQSWSNARNMVRNNQAYLDQADKLESKISQLTQTRQFWAEPGRDPEKAQQNFERIDGELAEAKKALRDLVRRAGNDRTSFDETRNRANPAGRPGVSNAAQSVDAAFQKLLQGEGSMEDFLISAVEAGDPDATAQVKQALIDQGVDPRVAENSTLLKEMLNNGQIDMIQLTDDMLSDASALVGRVASLGARGGVYAYGMLDPQGATKAIGMLDNFDKGLDRLAEEGMVPGKSGDRPAPQVDTETAAATSADELEKAYQEWRQMSRSERKKAGLPESEIGGQFYFSRFGAGFR